ncbi:phage terminase large subunit [Hymenobacter aerilatus]|uniref:Phage terminase large subunit n=1 Tax=Hymenobacter aerilatus TaxID=2932251 RepID=A0A8T9SVT0_9BACT|nr:phage terminase large subunit [Hymenobacter aerilatus]UOR05857.1 phage terminase large subunit [Hymenobacter aerilatus]
MSVKLNDIPSEDAILRDLCNRSFYRFFCEFWETIEAAPLIPSPHIKYICNELQVAYEKWERGESQDDIIINVPPGSSKSTVISQLYPAWLWVKDSSIFTLCTSYKAKLSTKNISRTKDCLTSKKFKSVFPNLIQLRDNDNSKTRFKNNNKGGEIEVSSTGGEATGNHYHFIIIDDPLSVKLAASEVARETANDYINTSLASRKKNFDTTVTILVMQRLHEEDPTGVWLSTKEVNHICLPAELTDNVKPVAARALYVDGLLDPVRKSNKVLKSTKVSLGSYAYAGQFLQQPAPSEGGLLKKHWFQKATWQQFQELTRGQKVVWEFDADTAYTKNTTNDPSALLASTYVNNTLYIRAVNQKWLELPELLRFIPKFLEDNGQTPDSKLYIEPKASGKSIVQSIRAETLVNVVEAPSPTLDKITRVHGIAAFVESLRVVLIDGSWNQDFIAQCATFPNAAHDDMVDCLTQRIERILAAPLNQKRNKAIYL